MRQALPKLPAQHGLTSAYTTVDMNLSTNILMENRMEVSFELIWLMFPMGATLVACSRGGDPFCS